jgi:hypothetical protein
MCALGVGPVANDASALLCVTLTQLALLSESSIWQEQTTAPLDTATGIKCKMPCEARVLRDFVPVKL